MKINLSEYPEFSENLSDLYYLTINKVHRNKSASDCELVFNIVQEDVDWLTTVMDKKDLPPDLIGRWLTNTITQDDYCGIQFSGITELTKVERKERQVTTTEVYYEPVNQ